MLRSVRWRIRLRVSSLLSNIDPMVTGLAELPRLNHDHDRAVIGEDRTGP